jgi:GT2 family glycosyltransferase
LRKKWIFDAGLFDDHPLMGYMDVEFGMRLKKMGVKKIISIKRCIAYHVDGYPTREWLNNLLSKFEERGRTSRKFIQRAESWTGERMSNRRVVLLSNLLSTPRWAEKKRFVDLLLKSVDSPFFFTFPLLKETLKLHYRAKGIRER